MTDSEISALPDMNMMNRHWVVPGNTTWNDLLQTEGITLTTFHVGSRDSLVVLDDWLDFFRSDIRINLRFVTCSDVPNSFDPSSIHDRITDVEVVDLPRLGLSATQLDPIGIWRGITEASTTLVALVKLDTLPFRTAKRSNWLQDVAVAADRHDAWGMTAFRSHECQRIDDSFALTPAFSHNFCIVNKSLWRYAVEREAPDTLERVHAGTPTPHDRIRFEGAVENHLRSTGHRNIRPAQTADWSAFHINQWEHDLLMIRDKYRRREGINRFLQSTVASPTQVWKIAPHQRYYGRRKPPIMRRIRVTAGRWRRHYLGW